ncbi:hypothetical protein BH23PLA1_BH23PLA1_21870 [soil metagenome]
MIANRTIGSLAIIALGVFLIGHDFLEASRLGRPISPEQLTKLHGAGPGKTIVIDVDCDEQAALDSVGGKIPAQDCAQAGVGTPCIGCTSDGGTGQYLTGLSTFKGYHNPQFFNSCGSQFEGECDFYGDCDTQQVVGLCDDLQTYDSQLEDDEGDP